LIMSVNISKVTFEQYQLALGVDEDCPRISWRFFGDGKDWIQEAYEIEVTRSQQGAAQLFRVQTSDSILVPWPAAPLRHQELARVRVRAYGQGMKETKWSDAVNVERGLSIDDWTASLIEPTRALLSNQSHQPVLFRRRFYIAKNIATARLYVTAHGVYEAEINGLRIGDQILNPGWTSYHHRLAYHTFDVTDHIRHGNNILGAYVGEGWFCGRLGFQGGKRNLWGDSIGLMAKLILHYEDGMQDWVETDEEWTWSTGPIISSEIYDGEIYDARLEQKGWSTAGFENGKAWSPVRTLPIPGKGRLKSPLSPPVRRIEEVPAVHLFQSPSGKMIVDFGQNLVGWLRVNVSGSAGHSISFTHTEVLENGECATRPLRFAKARDTVILSDADAMVWEPKFTFHGFRYVQVDNWPSRTLEMKDLTAVVLHTDMERTGWFNCSDPLLNQLHRNIVWGMRGNFLSIPTDCPQRDERLGWTGDLLVFAKTANYLYDACGTLKDWLKDLAAEQLSDENGIPPLVCPDVLRTPRVPNAIWGDVLVSAPWDLYQAYGDRELLLRQYKSMQMWIDNGILKDDRGLWRPGKFQLGDWLDPKAPPDEPGNGVTDPEFVANAFLIRITDLMAKISSAIGLSKDSARYKSSAAMLRSAFAKSYITDTGRVVSDSQTALALAIHFSLFAASTQERVAADRLKYIILTKSRFKIETGFAGTPILGHALTKVGESQLFYRVLLHKKCPSWLYPVTMGATTIWERWDAMLPDGSINPGEMTSFNHYALGAVAHWMHSVIGGLRPAEPGWKKILIQPIPGGTITHCSSQHTSPYGCIKVSWRLDGEDLRLNASIPPNSTAEVILPNMEKAKHIGSGDHEFCVRYERPQWPPLPNYFPFAPHDDDEP
jgi:alpha-L-rhamnosidase